MSVVASEIDPGSHLVHFYADDERLTSSVAGYAAQGLDAGEAVVLIAEPARLAAMRDRLLAKGSRVDAGPESGIHLLDAAATLDSFVEEGVPVRERFRNAVGHVLRSALPGHAGVRAYGEMVEILWRQGNIRGALALEQLWDELAADLPFTLYCAYRETLVGGPSRETVVDEACRLHSAVIGDGSLSRRSSALRRFARGERAPAAARTFVAETLDSQDAPAPLSDLAALVVSELATNAVRHGSTDFSVTLATLAHGIRIAVRDGDPQLPVLRSFTPADPGGWGLHIVDALSCNWGVTRHHDGKVVWAELEHHLPR